MNRGAGVRTPSADTKSCARADTLRFAVFILVIADPVLQVLGPCGHVCLCHACCQRLMQTAEGRKARMSCPLCAQEVASSIRMRGTIVVPPAPRSP